MQACSCNAVARREWWRKDSWQIGRRCKDLRSTWVAVKVCFRVCVWENTLNVALLCWVPFLRHKTLLSWYTCIKRATHHLSPRVEPRYLKTNIALLTTRYQIWLREGGVTVEWRKGVLSSTKHPQRGQDARFVTNLLMNFWHGIEWLSSNDYPVVNWGSEMIAFDIALIWLEQAGRCKWKWRISSLPSLTCPTRANDHA